MKKYLLLIVALSCVAFSFSQDLNGVWKGTLTQQAGGCFPVYYVELQVQVDGGAVHGASYHYSDISNYVKKKYSGAYDASLRKLSLAEGPVQTFKIPADCIPCIKSYDLWYSNNGKVETLRGEWNGKVMNTDMECQPGQLVLTRASESAFKGIPEVEVDTGTIQLDFYDNGEIDDDTISVFVNKKPILSRERLGVRPSTAHIKIDLENTFQEIEMVAENLGRIPPNTALLIVTAGSRRYRLYLTSTEQKSAMVRFIYEPTLSSQSKVPGN